jgi:transposase
VRQVMSGQTPKAAALAVGVCPRTIRKWVARYRAEGLAGLWDRSSRPRPACLPQIVGASSRLLRSAVGRARKSFEVEAEGTFRTVADDLSSFADELERSAG